VTSLDKALSILELMMQEGTSVPLVQISRKSGLGKGTVHRILDTLKARDYVQQDPETRRYGPGFRLFQLASRMEDRQFLRAILMPTLKEVWLQCDETVGAFVLEGNQSKNILRLISKQPLRISLEEGARFPAHCTAAGKALLSLLPDDKLRQIYNAGKPLNGTTKHSIQSFEALMKEMKEVRETRLAYGDEEAILGVFAIGVPIRNLPAGRLLSITIAGPKERIKERFPEYSRLITQAGDKIMRGFTSSQT